MLANDCDLSTVPSSMHQHFPGFAYKLEWLGYLLASNAGSHHIRWAYGSHSTFAVTKLLASSFQGEYQPVSNEASICPEKIACDCRTLTNSAWKANTPNALTHAWVFRVRLMASINLTKELPVVVPHLSQLKHKTPAKSSRTSSSVLFNMLGSTLCCYEFPFSWMYIDGSHNDGEVEGTEWDVEHGYVLMEIHPSCV